MTHTGWLADWLAGWLTCARRWLLSRRENVLTTVKEFGVNYDKTWIYDKMCDVPAPHVS